ncbi:MAG: ABC transporter substrate-binding protein [Ignavibacteria bacterium]|nr:ABC transporter substrate-binding protein [Ignavibacteria bacterium]
MNRRSISGSIFILFLISIACYGLGKDELRPVRLQLKWKHQFQFAGYYAAKEKGYYAAAGIDVHFIEAETGKEPDDAVFDRYAEFGVSTSDIVLSLGTPNPGVVLASIYQHSPLVLIAAKSAGIESIHDLAGKRVMIEPHAADILTYMADEGVPTSRCILFPHTFQVNELLDRHVDAMSAYVSDEPFALQQAHFPYTIISPRSGGIDFYGDILFTTQQMVKEQPALVEQFTKASLLGWKYALDHPEEIAQLIYSKYSKRHSIEALLYEANVTRRLILADVVEIGYSNKKRWGSIVEAYKKVGFLHASVNDDYLLYQDFIAPRSYVPLPLLIGSILAFIVISAIAFFFIFLSVKLRKEIRERDKARKALDESEQRYKYLIEELPASACITELENRTLILVNRKFVQMFAISTYDVRNLSPKLFYLDIEDREKIFNQLHTSGVVSHMELRMQSANRQNFWALLSAVRINYNGIPCAFFLIEDITSRKTAQLQLHEQYEYLNLLLNNLPVLVVNLSADGKIQFINKFAFEWFSVLPEDILGRSLLLALPPTFSEQERNFLMTKLPAVLSGQQTSFEFSAMQGNSSRHVIVQSLPHFLDGNLNSITLIATDITETRERELELQRLNATKDKFFSIIAHDLRAPVGTLHGVLTHFTETTHLHSADDRTLFGSLTEATNRVFNLLENLLTWARGQRGEIRPLIKMLKLQKLLTGAVDVHAATAAHKDIAISLHCDSEITCFADEDTLSVVFRNIISNAIKFTYRGGSLFIYANREPNGTTITFKDSGVGMPEDLVNNLFRVDKNVSQEGTEHERGTGLGLILCKEFIEMNKGSISVHSIPNQGTTFTVTLQS